MSTRISGFVHGEVLVVEDDAGDQDITRRALHRDNYQASLHIVNDGREALDYLHHKGAYEDPSTSPRPDLILLDLNLPRGSGQQVLGQVKGDSELRRIPTVIVSTSARARDIRESYDLGCSGYLIKPLEAHRYISALRELYTYWFGVVSLPD